MRAITNGLEVSLCWSTSDRLHPLLGHAGGGLFMPPHGPAHSGWCQETYSCRRRRDWTRGTYLSNAEQATGIIEWMSRWNLRPGTTKVVADDAVFNATGSDRGSTAGDFKAAGCPLIRAGKMNAREANGLALVRTMLQASGRDPETPWLIWITACQGLMATWPTLPRHPRDVERIADGCANHSLDAVRYGVMWWRAKWKTGSAKSRMGQVW